MRIRMPSQRLDDTGSLPFAMVIAVVGLGISAILGTTLLAQVRDVRRVADRGHALGAAETGLQVALGYVRAAAAGSDGKIKYLPCGVIEGTMPGTGAAYKVEVSYLSADNSVLSCPLSATPTSVKLKSWDVAGTPAPGASAAPVEERAVAATYPIRLPDLQVPTGVIRNFTNASAPRELCLDAGSPTPAAGAVPTMQPCDSGLAQQKFAYVKSMSLVRPRPNGSTAKNMCLEAREPSVTTPTMAAVTFQECKVQDLDATSLTTNAYQLWSMNSKVQGFQGADGGSRTGWCLAAQYPGQVASPVVYQACGGGTNTATTLRPDPGVGAGRAGDATRQLVNYAQYGRCLEAPGGVVTGPYLVGGPCGSGPVADPNLWNQRFTLPAATENSGATGRVTVTTAGVDYCLRSPLTTEVGAYVTLTPCSTAVARQVTWTRYTKHRNATKAYTLVDAEGYCLQLSGRPGDTYETGPENLKAKMSKAVVGTCDASELLQRWNAELAPVTGLKDVQKD